MKIYYYDSFERSAPLITMKAGNIVGYQFRFKKDEPTEIPELVAYLVADCHSISGTFHIVYAEHAFRVSPEDDDFDPERLALWLRGSIGVGNIKPATLG